MRRTVRRVQTSWLFCRTFRSRSCRARRWPSSAPRAPVNRPFLDCWPDWIRRARAALRARLLGFVFQSFQLLPALNALENVMLPLELAGEAGAADRAARMLARVGLAERLRHYPKTLSGGEQQRVALARAFVTQPQLLLADEPTGNLDAATGAGVIDLMFELNAERGTTLLLVTHDEAIAGRCGRKIRLAAGRIDGEA